MKIAIQDMPFIGFHSGVKFVPTNSTLLDQLPLRARIRDNGPWWWWSWHITTEITPCGVMHL